ncbi:MAG: hypothetical protein AAF581_09545, partial [Planctomycetota bacterium]
MTRMRRVLFLVVSGLTFAICVSAAAPARGVPVWVAGHWFQQVGRLADGRDGWLYPHVDGVHELFRAAPGASRWEGQLGSVFDARSGVFARRFHAAELLNELLDDERSVPVRRRAARLLELFKRLHGGETPFYLRHSEARARRYLSE